MSITNVEIGISGQAPQGAVSLEIAGRSVLPDQDGRFQAWVRVPESAKSFALTTRFADGRTTVRSLLVREFANVRTLGANG